MSGGLIGLLDDVAALARLAAASVDDVGAAAGRAATKTAGVVVDDAAVTPQYVRGLAAERELPIIRRIAVGSLRNKLLVILPVALVLSQLVPWLLTPVLMAGGLYLCYEGAHKVHGAWHARRHPAPVEDPATAEPVSEDEVVRGAVRTDFILSAEIMVIALNEVADQSLATRAAVLAVVGVLVTVAVYGVVALIVKTDDVGLALAQRGSRAAERVGLGLVRAMPRVLATLSVVGTAAMIWVGGHIWLVGLEELGWAWPYDTAHHAAEVVAEAVAGVGAVLGWLLETVVALVLGAALGAVVLAVRSRLPGAH